MSGAGSGKRPDLTRWNRAGLSRFQYVDGDAAVWLEELRLALFSLYARGADAASRDPALWRDLSLRPPGERPGPAELAEVLAAVPWKALAPALPPEQETRGRRSERLLGQYNRPPGDLGWEIMRAFARAAHVVLGYLDAYANEGYLRTATQWENLRRLAAMVNYQPTPPASASTTVALLLAPDAGAVTIDRGLGFRHTPPAGGAPLVFETLEPVACHPHLNAARVKGWNSNSREADFSNPTTWNVPGRAALAPGDVAVVAAGDGGTAATLKSVERQADAATIGFAETLPKAQTDAVRLWTEPDGVRHGLAVTRNGRVVVEVPPQVTATVGAIVEINGGYYRVKDVRGRQVVIETSDKLSGTVTFAALAPFAASGGAVTTGTAIEEMIIAKGDDVARVKPEEIEEGKEGQKLKLHRFPTGKAETAFVAPGSAERFDARVVTEVESVVPGRRTEDHRTVRFEGKPPKGLTEGDWFAARKRGDDALTALRVTGIRLAAGSYVLDFHADAPAAPESTEFHGPMRRALTLTGFDRSQNPASAGGAADLIGIAPAARLLLKPGRAVVVARGADATLATLAAIEDRPDGVTRITLTSGTAGWNWPAGETVFHLNTVRIGHGETKGPETLGSGDGERPVQAFDFAVRDVSHVASTLSESGVIPDMDVTVDGERWDYRDFIDAGAENTRSWSSTLTDQGTLRIHFRSRLPTGIDNVAVRRHRVGVGLAGTGIPGSSMARPARKHRYVQAAVQPFATTGGADREPIERLRHSAPSACATSSGWPIAMRCCGAPARRQFRLRAPRGWCG